MKKAGLTRQERSLIALMRIWVVLFLGAGILFSVAPDYVPSYLQRVGSILLGWDSPPFPPPAERFWLVLAVAYLLLLAYCCAIAQRGIVRNSGYVRPVILGKLATSIGFLVCFLISGRHFVYFVGAVVDGAICLITWRFYAGAIKSRS